MWWQWVLLVIGAFLVVSCAIGTTIDWVKGKTGPLGPRPEDWRGCGVFTIVVLLLMVWVGRGLIR